VWYPTIPNPPQSGFWDDPTKWYGGVVPQGGDTVEIFGIGDSTFAEPVTVTYRNTYDPEAVFNSLTLGTWAADINFILHDDLNLSGTASIGQNTTFDHSAGTLLSSAVHIVGDGSTAKVSSYRLYGTAALTDIGGIGATWGGLSLHVSQNAKFQMEGGSLTANYLELTGADGIPPLYRQTGGTANFHRIYLQGSDDSAFRISGGTANVYGDLYLGSNSNNPDSPPPADGAVAALEISGLGTLDLFHPEQPLLAGLLVGDDFPATVHQAGSSHVEVGHILYVGFKTSGTYTLDGGTLDGSLVFVGYHSVQPELEAPGEFIQNGGTVTLTSNQSFEGGLAVGFDAPGTYRLNNGLLSTETTTVLDTFVQTGGTHQCSANLAVGGNYIFSDGVIDTEQLAINSGVLHYNGGTLTDRGFKLWGGTLNQAAGLHHQTDGDGQIRYSGSTLALGTGASHAITGQLALLDTSFALDSGAISCGSLFTDFGPVVLDQNGGNLTILGPAELHDATVWKLRSGVVFHGGDLALGAGGSPTDGSSLQQSGGIYTARGFTLHRDTGMILSGGTTQLSEDGVVHGALDVQPGADLALRDLAVGDGSQLPASAIFSGGHTELATLNCQSGSSCQQTGGSLVTTGAVTLNQSATGAMGFHGGTADIGGSLDYRGLGNLGGGNTLFLVDDGAALTIHGDFLVGDSGGFLQSGNSSIEVTGAHGLAGDTDADVFQSLANGSTLSSASAVVGGLGRGRLQISGQHTVGGLLEIGASAAWDSRYTLFGSGRLHAGSVHIASRAGGGGRLDLLGGTTTVDATLTVADATDAAGDLRLNAGILNVADLVVGGDGVGSVLHENGILNCTDDLTVSSGSSYLFTAGRITANRVVLGGGFEISSSGLSTPYLRGPVNNTGILTFKRTAVTDAASLSHSNSGTIDLQSASEWQFYDNNRLTNLPAGNISGLGSLGGSGFQLINQGTLSPGGLFAWGALTIRGDLTQAAGATLRMKIAGTATSEYDRLVIGSGGSAALNGKLSISFANIFTPAAGQSFQLISAADISGGFADIEITSPLPPGLDYTVTALAGGVTLNIVARPLVSDPGGPYTVDEGAAISLDGAASFAPDGVIASYAWDLDNDGTFETAGNPVNYDATVTDGPAGPFTVSLRVTGSAGGTATAMTTVTVNNVAPTAEAGGPYSGAPSTPVALSGFATDPAAADTLTFQWDLDGDGAYETDGQNIEATFHAAGTFTVGLRVTDDDGGVGTGAAEIIITGLQGDISGNRQIGLEDAIIALRMLSGMHPDQYYSNYAAAGVDVNGDGLLGLEEAVAILRMVGNRLSEGGAKGGGAKQHSSIMR